MENVRTIQTQQWFGCASWRKFPWLRTVLDVLRKSFVGSVEGLESYVSHELHDNLSILFFAPLPKLPTKSTQPECDDNNDQAHRDKCKAPPAAIVALR